MGIFGGEDKYTKQDAIQQYNFMGDLIGEQNAAWGTNQAISQQISNMWASVAKSGQLPYGFAPSLDAALRTNIFNLGTQATTNAVNAQQLREQQESGGAPVLPTGANAQTEAVAQTLGQQQTAQALGQERIAGYQQGVTNLTSATKGLETAGELESPTGIASAAVGEGGNVNKVAQLGSQEQQSNLLHSVLSGGVAGALGNLDTAGTSSAGEQGMNLLTGFAAGI